jgi:hypothetical protein
MITTHGPESKTLTKDALLEFIDAGKNILIASLESEAVRELALACGVSFKGTTTCSI